ncbi:M23 family metallopeptidase [Hoyosella rhizosphaerae]|nr:M23 family metallopeptidase [Hoyosella rhizosphaerae]
MTSGAPVASAPTASEPELANHDVLELAAPEISGRHTWPLHPRPTIARRFEPPAHRYGPGHRGVDLSAAAGASVHASATGVVVFAGPVGGRPVISIDHPGGIRTTYEPVSPLINPGDTVTQGQHIGDVISGHNGCAVDACLHWGARHSADRLSYIDPLILLGLIAIRLKPLGPD